MELKRRPECSASPKVRKKRTSLTLETKLEILSRVDAGEGPAAVGRAFNLGESTIRSVKKNADKIRRAVNVMDATPRYAKLMTRVRNPLMEKMEATLSQYIVEQEAKNRIACLSNKELRHSALRIYERLCQEQNVSEPEPFQASKGWLVRFISRKKQQGSNPMGELVTNDREPVANFPDELRTIINEMGYRPQQVFNAVESSLFWKRMPLRTYISKEEEGAPEFRVHTDRLTLLLCSNAAGDCKLKPLLVYNSLNPSSLKGMSKSTLPVHWTASNGALVTGQVFEDWFTKCFAAQAERYCLAANLPFKVLLVLDTGPSHLLYLDDINPNIRILFLPPSTASLIQPLQQGVTSTFRAHYLRRALSQLHEATENCDSLVRTPAIHRWWKSYNMKAVIENIQGAWEDVKQSTLNCCWSSLWPDCVMDFMGLPEFTFVVHEIVEIGKKVGGGIFSDMKVEDVTQVISSHEDEVNMEDLCETTEDNKECEEAEQQGVQEVKNLTTLQLSAFLSQAEALVKGIINADPNYERSLQFKHGLETILSPYRELHAEKQKMARQSSLSHSQFHGSWTSVAIPGFSA